LTGPRQSGCNGSAAVFSRGSPSNKKNYQSARSSAYHTFSNIGVDTVEIRGITVRAEIISSTVKNYLATVRHTQVALSLGDPKMGNMPQLEYGIKDLKRSVTYSTSRTRLPVTPELLGLMKGLEDVG
jgi:hypothetical protein